MGPSAVSSMSLVLAALRDALRDLSRDPASEALRVRIEALALLLQQPREETVPPALDALTLHLADFGAFLQRSLANPSALASLAGPAAELCVAWRISTEALDTLRLPPQLRVVGGVAAR